MKLSKEVVRRTARLEMSEAADVRPPLRGTAPPTLNIETRLSDVTAVAGDCPFVIAVDDSGRVAGVVSRSQIEERLSSSNQFERNRWERMPLGALLNIAFSEARIDGMVPMDKAIECVTISENDRLFGISVDNDLFLSWRRIESLLSVALSDPLTGLMNRLAYERRLSEEWVRAERLQSSIGVVVVDLNRFKHINDTWGHPVGDQVLREVALRLEASMRSYDVVARFGGDEFVALCLGCQPASIQIPIRRIQHSIDSINIEVEGLLLPVEASVGAAVRHDGFSDADPRDLFAAADECLYRAKASDNKAWFVEFGGGCPSGARRATSIAAESSDGRSTDDYTSRRQSRQTAPGPAPFS